VNPQVVSHYRGRHGSSRAKSDRGDARVLADLVRTDRHGAMLRCLNERVASLEQQLAARFAAHPDAVIRRSLPGLGMVLGARVLAEFGDDPARYHTAKGRKAFAGTAPVTRSSGLRTVVIA
jgi:transposase